MAPPQETFSSAAEDDGDLGYVLEVARDALAHEFQVSERLDAKARGQMTMAGAWFAVVQAVAGVALANDGISNLWMAGILVTAGAAGIALGWAFYRHYKVWKLRDETGFNAEALRAFGGWAADKETDLGGTLVGYYERILSERQDQNRERGRDFDQAVPAWFIALGLALAELMVALIATTSV